MSYKVTEESWVQCGSCSSVKQVQELKREEGSAFGLKEGTAKHYFFFSCICRPARTLVTQSPEGVLEVDLNRAKLIHENI